jgi:hypothetical protein
MPQAAKSTLSGGGRFPSWKDAPEHDILHYVHGHDGQDCHPRSEMGFLAHHDFIWRL